MLRKVGQIVRHDTAEDGGLGDAAPTPLVVCRDEQPVQVLRETRVPIAATRPPGRRVDDAYERNGTASMVLFAEPLSGCRQAPARAQRPQADWASEGAPLLDTRYAPCKQVTLGGDNLHTPTPGAFYAAFEPRRARTDIKASTFATPRRLGAGAMSRHVN
jgi:hypothetical protein